MKDLDLADRLMGAIEARTATVGVCGLGYVGLPLAAAIAEVGFRVIGFDIDAGKIEEISARQVLHRFRFERAAVCPGGAIEALGDV